MKRVLLLLGLIIASNMVFGGGIVTNTNQSTGWTRMLARNASTDIDAVFFNPAALTKLPDGLHFSLSNQVILQDMSITNSSLGKTFDGEVFAPVFPNLYAVYKKDRLAFSLGFTVIGGGGSASYSKGVPMMELPVSFAAKAMTMSPIGGATGDYSMNKKFDGSSVYFGFQAGVTYAISDAISIFGGARYVWIKNTYDGEMKDIMFKTATGDKPADEFMSGLSTQMMEIATTAQSVGDMMSPLVASPAANLTFAEAQGAGALTLEQRQQLEMGLQKLGKSNAEIEQMTLKEAQTIYYGASQHLNGKAQEIGAGARLLGDQSADVKQTGGGIAPIVGVNVSFLEDKLNIGVKYEFKPEIEIENETPKGKGFAVGFNPQTGDVVEMFPDGKKTDADMPALFSVGAQYKVSDKLSAQVCYLLYFDKKIGWAKETQNGIETDIIDNNFFEIGLGVEYQLSEKLRLSAGYLRGNTGVADNYHNDTRFSLSSDNFGFGGVYKINEMLKLEAGAFYSKYDDKTVGTQTYEKSTMGFSVGLDFTLGK